MKIKTAVQPQPVRTSYTPLKASFGIVIDGGSPEAEDFLLSDFSVPGELFLYCRPYNGGRDTHRNLSR